MIEFCRLQRRVKAQGLKSEFQLRPPDPDRGFVNWSGTSTRRLQYNTVHTFRLAKCKYSTVPSPKIYPCIDLKPRIVLITGEVGRYENDV